MTSKRMAVRIRPFKKLFLCIFVFLLCILILEISLRMLGRAPSNMAEGVYVQNGDSYRLKKNITKLTRWPSLSYITYTNEFGFRDRKTGNRHIKDRKYVVFLGACETYGSGLNYEETYVGLLDDLMRKEGIEVLNLAVPGHFLKDQENTLLEFLRAVKDKPSTAIICVSQYTLHKYDKAISNTFVRDGYLFDKRKIKIISYIKVFLSNNLASYCFFRDNTRQLISNLFGVNTQAASDFFELFLKQGKMANPQERASFFAYFEQLEEGLKKKNIAPVYVYIPLIDTFNLESLMIRYKKNPLNYDRSLYANLLKEHCQKNNIKYINLEPVLERIIGQGKSIRISFHPYFNECAHKAIAETIYETLKKELL